MNKKLLAIPTVLLSVSLLLTACSGGGDDKNIAPTNAPTSNNQTSTQEPIVGGYQAPPTDLQVDFKAYFSAPSTVLPEAWGYYSSIGAKTFQEDPAPRTIDAKQLEEKRTSNQQESDKVFGEMMSDRDQTSLKATALLKANPKATIEELNGKDIIINRYTNLGSTQIAQDKSTGFYFVVFTAKDSPRLNGGVIVEQEGITPDFHMTPQ